jgi:lysophospholipase L1-like esterase
LLFCILPTAALLGFAEGVLGVAELAKPSLFTLPFVQEAEGLLRPDKELFWALRPNLDRYSKGVKATVRTNSLGLRTYEVDSKKPNEFRILSLGESTTFGMGVPNEKTYSAVLEESLNRIDKTHFYRVINAGVSAYSSFQSLKYLERRGLRLKPDLVLFYHEVNDYLPSSLRDSSNTELSVLKTDRQLYESRIRGVSRKLMDYSVLYRFVSLRFAYHRVRAFNREEFDNPLLEIGLPDIGIFPRLASLEKGNKYWTDLNEQSLGRRVSESERRQNLEDLVGICRSNGIRLVCIHPSYANSRKHECLLTAFCRDQNVPMFGAHDVLHPPEADGTMFIDAWHPNAEGHRLLAEGVCEFLLNQGLLLKGA